MSNIRFYIFTQDLKQPVKLKNDPEGWDTGGIIRKRDMKWHGVFFEYSPRLRFVKDGRNIIAYFYEQYGIEADLTLIIQRRDLNGKFKTDYIGRFNLVTLEINELYAECNIEQSGFLQKFKNRQDVKVNVSSLLSQSGKALTPFVSESVDVELHSKVLRKVHDTYFIKGPGQGESPNGIFGQSMTDINKFIQVQPDGINQNEINEWFDTRTAITDVLPVNQFKLSESGNYVFDYRFEVSSYRREFDLDDESCNTLFPDRYYQLQRPTGSTANVQFYIKINDEAPIAFSRTNIQMPTILVGQGSTVFTLNLTRALTKEDLITIYIDITGAFHPAFGRSQNDVKAETLLIWGSEMQGVVRGFKQGCVFQGYEFYPDFTDTAPSGAAIPSYQRIYADTVVPATEAPLILKHEAFTRIIESITDEKDSFRSAYYGRTDSEPVTYDEDGAGSLRGLLSGKLLRGFPHIDNPVSMSFKDLFESCTAIDGVGIGIDRVTDIKERIIIEPISYFYRPERVVQFTNVADIKKTVAPDFYANELEAGYDRWNNEQQNNLDEFNTRREFTLPITQVKNKLTLKSIYLTSGYTIEFVRRDPYNEGTSKDNDRDNDVFIIQLRRNDGNLVTDKDEDFAELNNLISPETVYNAKLSVMRNIIRNGELIRGGLFHQSEDFIRLTFGEGNTAFTSRLTTETELVDETQIQVKKLPRAIWIPEIYSFKIKPTRAQNAALDQNPYGLIEFSTSTKDFKKGYLLETIPDDESDLTEFKVLKANI